MSTDLRVHIAGSTLSVLRTCLRCCSAIFQGLHPYTVGRTGIAEYYDSQPAGLAAEYRIAETRRLTNDLVLGYLDVDFSFTDRPTLTVQLSLRLEGDDDGWAIRHYQVSRL
ncbi:hypothetical protein ACWEOI_19065 [Nocardia sp. NPDC004340]